MAALFLLQPVSAASAFMKAQSATIASPSSSLVLTIDGFETQTGDVLVALFNSQESYAAETPLEGNTQKVDSRAVEVRFSGLPVGTYAFKLFHDVNDNGELDTDTLGIPSEPYYFSNDASDPFSAPEWEEAKFNVPYGQVTKVISLD